MENNTMTNLSLCNLMSVLFPLYWAIFPISVLFFFKLFELQNGRAIFINIKF